MAIFVCNRGYISSYFIGIIVDNFITFA